MQHSASDSESLITSTTHSLTASAWSLPGLDTAPTRPASRPAAMSHLSHS